MLFYGALTFCGFPVRTQKNLEEEDPEEEMDLGKKSGSSTGRQEQRIPLSLRLVMLVGWFLHSSELDFFSFFIFSHVWPLFDVCPSRTL
jgi:hypothetical protein